MVDWDERETPELMHHFGERGIRLHVVGDELQVEVSGRLTAEDRDTLSARRWDLIRHLRRENTTGLRFAPDGKSYRRRMPEPLPVPLPTTAEM